MRKTTFQLLPLLAFALAPAFIHAQTNSNGWEKGVGSFDTSTSIRPLAVSELNGKLGYAGGDMNSSESHNFDGSITFPIADEFGFQADGLYSHIDDDDFFGGAGHIFWRNPEMGLLGLTGGYLSRSGLDTFQVGVEAEYYWNRFTFGAFAGAGSISYSHRAPFIDTDPLGFVGKISASYYIIEDLRVGVSFLTALDNNLIKGEVEYQTPICGLAFTGEFAGGDHGYDHWLLGIRYYFGSKKSLMERQRRDDPPSLMPQILNGLGLYDAEYNRKAKHFAKSHSDWNGGGSGVGVTTVGRQGR